MVSPVDYNCSAELFPASSARRGKVSYRRFGSLAEALRYAIEELSPALIVGAYLEANEIRYAASEMRQLYDADEYPLPRRVPPG